MKNLKKTAALILTLAVMLCSLAMPASAAENRALTPVGAAYDYLLENGYPAMSTQQFVDTVLAVDKVISLVTGNHITPDSEMFNLVLDEKLEALCASVTAASGLDVDMILHCIPEFNTTAVEINEKYNIDIPKLQATLNEMSAKCGEQGNGTLANLIKFVSVYMGIIDEFLLYCVPVDGMDGVYEVHAQMTYRDGRKESIGSGLYYDTVNEQFYGKDGNGMLGIGFDFDVGSMAIITPINVWMRNLGFCVWYDIAGYVLPLFNYRTARIKFDYDGAEWMVQLWKGRYVVATGAEVGIYKRAAGSMGTFYSCVEDEDMLRMSFDLLHGDELIVSRESTYHWWLTAFALRETIYLPESLTLDSTIEFKDTEMAKAFCEGIENRNFSDIEYVRNGKSVTIQW